MLLAGVGPKEVLELLGIETLVDLKVGHDLKDQMSFLGLNFILNGTQTAGDPHYDEVVDYLKNGHGPLTTPGIEIIGFIKTEASKEQHDQPDVELLFTNKLYNKGKRLHVFGSYRIW